MKTEYKTISVRAVIRKGNKILTEWFVPKSISFLPGGTVEPDEELESALIRELDEELTGANLRVGRYLGKIGHFWSTPKGSNSCLNHFYEVILEEDFGVSAREPGREMKWLSLDDDKAQTLQPPSLARLLKQYPEVLWDQVDCE